MYLLQFSNHRQLWIPIMVPCALRIWLLCACTFLHLATHCWSGRKIDSACLMMMTGWGRTVAVTFVYLSAGTIGFRSARREAPFHQFRYRPRKQDRTVPGVSGVGISGR
ncbi:uncharacterized protein BO72DRAFT_162108 [Aspergillus fijiensis CBS 313.89]|uniref:Uncharacterized protein n=1 Tax=Aspergillus fijiensis CBS 313.89 TaxID=1448319 RepID=A0A8G1RLS6_9EURO|nr:uncharacterized protein BO72DRAFT_162108 [Aspergillus fijiensis CBS 313.89]RAK75594.1 hypothetical protein BO72DRAFT_162108 [Aspergillus fijiensis CBS 313.89]